MSAYTSCLSPPTTPPRQSRVKLELPLADREHGSWSLHYALQLYNITYPDKRNAHYLQYITVMYRNALLKKIKEYKESNYRPEMIAVASATNALRWLPREYDLAMHVTAEDSPTKVGPWPTTFAELVESSYTDSEIPSPGDIAQKTQARITNNINTGSGSAPDPGTVSSRSTGSQEPTSVQLLSTPTQQVQDLRHLSETSSHGEYCGVASGDLDRLSSSTPARPHAKSQNQDTSHEKPFAKAPSTPGMGATTSTPEPSSPAGSASKAPAYNVQAKTKSRQEQEEPPQLILPKKSNSGHQQKLLLPQPMSTTAASHAAAGRGLQQLQRNREQPQLILPRPSSRAVSLQQQRQPQRQQPQLILPRPSRPVESNEKVPLPHAGQKRSRSSRAAGENEFEEAQQNSHKKRKN